MRVQVARLRDLLPAGGSLDERTWRVRHFVLMGLLAVHLPVLATIGLVSGDPPLQIAAALSPILPGLAIGYWARSRRTASIGVAAALMLCSITTLHFTDWLVETNLTYLILLIFIALYQDWWPYLVALALVVVHIVLGVLNPAALSNYPFALANPFAWGFVHAGFGFLLTIGTVTFWKMTEVEHERALVYYQQLYESERALFNQLREAERLKNELIAVVSHEFRTPLTSILGYAQTLSARIHEIDKANALMCAEQIERQAKRLSRLVHNLLAASGDVCIEPGLSSDLHEVVADVVEELSESAPKVGRRIDMSVPHGLRAAIGRDSMHQVVLNLVDNALKFAEDDTVVQVRGRRLHEYAILEVANVGALIPPEVRERIFQPFVQLDSSDTRNFDGIGLGLSIVRKVVHAHHGIVEVRGDGQLVVFRVTLPTPAGSAATASVTSIRAVAR